MSPLFSLMVVIFLSLFRNNPTLPWRTSKVNSLYFLGINLIFQHAEDIFLSNKSMWKSQVFIQGSTKETGPERCWTHVSSTAFCGSLKALHLARIRLWRWFELFESEKLGWKYIVLEIFGCLSFLTSMKNWSLYVSWDVASVCWEHRGHGGDLLASWGCLKMSDEDVIPPAMGLISTGKFERGSSEYSHIFLSLSKILFNFGCKSHWLCCKDRGEEFAETLLDANPHACQMQIWCKTGAYTLWPGSLQASLQVASMDKVPLLCSFHTPNTQQEKKLTTSCISLQLGCWLSLWARNDSLLKLDYFFFGK